MAEYRWVFTLVLLAWAQVPYNGYTRPNPVKFNQGKIPIIKIKIAKELSTVTVSGTDIKREFHIGKRKSKVFAGKKSIQFNCQGKHTKNQENRTILLASISSPAGLVSLSKKKFQGKLLLVTSDNKSCDVVNMTSIEDYISSLLAKEMNGSWPLEALKAQAVAARSYAIEKMETKQVSKSLGFEAYYDLESSEKHQVGGNFFDATLNTLSATKSTKGEILISKSGRLTPIFFHAKCGGRTLRPDEVWDNNIEGYKSRPCPFCKNRGKKEWRRTVSIARLKKFLSWATKKFALDGKTDSKALAKSNVILAPDKISNKKIRIYLEDKLYVFSKPVLRKYFGRSIIPSNNYIMKLAPAGLKIIGSGNGHGVGMCQLGALQLADKGWSYKKILSYYFPEHSLKKVY